MPTESTFDPAVYETLKTSVNGDSAFLAALIEDYLADTKQHLATLRRAVENRNARLLEHTAHSLKSTSETLGAMALASVSRKIEALAHQGQFDEAAEHIPVATAQFDAARGMLRDKQAALNDAH